MVQIKAEYPILEKEIQKLVQNCEKINQPLTNDQIELIKKVVAGHACAAGMDSAVFKEAIEFPLGE